MISIIAAIGKNWELGRKGNLIFHIKEDMKYFKEMTLGHKVVMGRKTWESLPGKLPGRENIVVSRGEVVGADQVIHDLDEFLLDNVDTGEEVFVIGGGEIYKEALPYAQNIYLTEVDVEVGDADAFFPEFDRSGYKKEIIKEGQEDDLVYTFVKYSKN